MISTQKEHRPHISYRVIVYINSKEVVNKKEVKIAESESVGMPGFSGFLRFLADFSLFLGHFSGFFMDFLKIYY
jgi:hypothetical protein